MGGGRRAASRSLALLAGTTALTQPAHAGAWAMAEGVQQWFAAVSHETGDKDEAWRADDFIEFGLGGNWAVNAKIESEIRISDFYDDRTSVQVGVLKAFALSDRASFSVQASLLGGEAVEGPECQDAGVELRAALGTSFSLFGREGFVNAETASRSRGDCERQIMEVAAGLEFAPTWNLVLKAWDERGSGSGNLSTKAEASLSKDIGAFRIGLGWREEISGKFEEKGWVASLRATF